MSEIFMVCLLPCISSDFSSSIHDLFINLLAGVIFLIIYEKIYIPFVAYLKNKVLIGRFIHCDITYTAFMNNGHSHYSDISISFFKPNILLIESHDFTNGKERIWRGEIKIDSDTRLFGHGSYQYENSIDSGIHNIIILDNEVICVQISDFRGSGAAQLWIKEGNKMIKYGY